MIGPVALCGAPSYSFVAFAASGLRKESDAALAAVGVALCGYLQGLCGAASTTTSWLTSTSFLSCCGYFFLSKHAATV